MLDVAWLQRLHRFARAAMERRTRRELMVVAAIGAAAAAAALYAAIPLGGGAAVDVQSVAFTLPPRSERLIASIAIENDGSLPALITGSNNAFVLAPKEMTSREEDDEWDHLGDIAETHQVPRSLAPGQRWPDYAVVKTLERKEYQAFLAGAALIYFLMRTQYRDASLPATKHRVTEACYYYVKDPQRPHSCRGHNRRYVSD